MTGLLSLPSRGQAQLRQGFDGQAPASEKGYSASLAMTIRTMIDTNPLIRMAFIQDGHTIKLP